MWLILAAILAGEPQQVAMPAWMAGCWERKSGESWTEECWTGDRAGQMMGSSRSGKGEALQWYEHTRITAEGSARRKYRAHRTDKGGCGAFHRTPPERSWPREYASIPPRSHLGTQGGSDANQLDVTFEPGEPDVA